MGATRPAAPPNFAGPLASALFAIVRTPSSKKPAVCLSASNPTGGARSYIVALATHSINCWKNAAREFTGK